MNEICAMPPDFLTAQQSIYFMPFQVLLFILVVDVALCDSVWLISFGLGLNKDGSVFFGFKVAHGVGLSIRDKWVGIVF